ncbi:hypothetical protein E3U55_06485 [Filobacillus milosensis]|uniref:Uncharacterized protein n=1 Tax=Filobacillus milosensis TaxID=94137 RepID=A0A4Y8IS98_9BACI|nr:hypothetical protein [Filobacillus milosensis]TFB22882.1 hypothetical protein E3U55_06485 [Filobacillus milosensis]
MKKMIIYGAIIILFLSITIWATMFQPGIDNPTARDILNNSPNADIIKLDGLIYLNATESDKRELVKGEKIGEIKGQSSTSWWFWNLYATKLPEGTDVYTTKDNNYNNGDAPFTILVELEGKTLKYKALVEG